MLNRIFSPLKRKDRWNLERFSNKLLEKEIELEKHYKLEVIEDLIMLYSEAIEHYNEICDPRFYDFQLKLQGLLVRPEVSSVLNKRNLESFYSINQRKSKQSRHIAISKILEKSRPLSSLVPDTDIPKASNPKSSTQYRQSSLSISLQKNLQQQDYLLEQKLIQRSSRRKTFNSYSLPSQS